MKRERKLVLRVEQIIKEANVNARIIWHREWGKKTETVAKILGIGLEYIIKCLIFLDSRDEPLMAVVTGNKRVNITKLEQVSGKIGLRLANAKEIERITGHPIGGVPPVGLNIPVFVDIEVLTKNTVYGSAGSPYAGLEIKPEDLVKLANAEVVDIGL
ncbi:MAG: YbaK/EbsC family protein [Candidatus Bathyarchaeia archaeon]